MCPSCQVNFVVGCVNGYSSREFKTSSAFLESLQAANQLANCANFVSHVNKELPAELQVQPVSMRPS